MPTRSLMHSHLARLTNGAIRLVPQKGCSPCVPGIMVVIPSNLLGILINSLLIGRNKSSAFLCVWVFYSPYEHIYSAILRQTVGVYSGFLKFYIDLWLLRVMLPVNA